jgi:hypothetical protein
MNGTTSSEAVRLLPVRMPLDFADEKIALYAFELLLKVAERLDEVGVGMRQQDEGEGEKRQKLDDHEAEDDLRDPLQRQQREQPDDEQHPHADGRDGALARDVVRAGGDPRVRERVPRPVRVNGMKIAVNWAFAARMYVNATAMPMPTIAPSAGEITRDTYSPPARGIACSRYL